jgi:hypothetical protein
MRHCSHTERRDRASADFCPCVYRPAVQVIGNLWLFAADFQSAVFFAQFAAVLVRFSVAVLMAVRCQLLCILLRWIAMMARAAKYLYQIAYATVCE